MSGATARTVDIRVSTEGEPYPEHEGKRGTPSMGGAAILAGCALVAAVLVWQLPDLLKLATSDAPNITGVGSRY